MTWNYFSHASSAFFNLITHFSISGQFYSDNVNYSIQRNLTVFLIGSLYCSSKTSSQPSGLTP